MVFGVPKETYPGEKRVAMIPAVLPALKKLGLEVWIESGAGAGAHLSDEDFRQAGAQIASSRQELLAKSDIVAYVRAPGADKNNLGDLAQIKKGAVLLGHTEPFASAEIALQIAQAGLTSFSLELVPRITRAQSMDVLSSMASMAGYRAVLLAATHFGRIFPMYMTAAGTLLPAKVFIVG
ncbi:MAG: NAD(P)(+) transhydrogenase (Re/Si-specific) subunit alpha, partial [Spirochaetales bacterium]|nr:NAD(P)(+) transhydrogenase (Re/Si-specific) subunit alpha [Spirochaetales bacterium]